jgi:hypothetical protein
MSVGVLSSSSRMQELGAAIPILPLALNLLQIDLKSPQLRLWEEMTKEGNYECVRRLSRRESNRGQDGEGGRNRRPLEEAFRSEG